MPSKTFQPHRATVRSATTEPTVEQEQQADEAVDVPWNVVAHNDPITTQAYVTMVFQKVFGFSRAKSKSHMLEVHETGRSIVWTGVRERAELYVEQLHGHQLLSTLERSN